VTSPITQGLHRSVRAVVWQVLAVAVVALAWSAKGGAWALAAALGGAAATLGGWLFARVALGGGIGAAGRALNRLLLGIGRPPASPSACPRWRCWSAPLPPW